MRKQLWLPERNISRKLPRLLSMSMRVLLREKKWLRREKKVSLRLTSHHFCWGSYTYICDSIFLTVTSTDKLWSQFLHLSLILSYTIRYHHCCHPLSISGLERLQQDRQRDEQRVKEIEEERRQKMDAQRLDQEQRVREDEKRKKLMARQVRRSNNFCPLFFSICLPLCVSLYQTVSRIPLL